MMTCSTTRSAVDDRPRYLKPGVAPSYPDGGWQMTRYDPGRNLIEPLGGCNDHPPHPTEDAARDCYERWRGRSGETAGETETETETEVPA